LTTAKAGVWVTAWKASMSSDEPTTGTTNPRRRIFWLVVGHVVIGLIGALAAYLPDSDYSARRAAFVGLVFSQTSLLGIWGGLGSGPAWRRGIGVVVGVCYLSLQLGVSFSELDRITFLWGGAATTISALPLLLVRLFGAAIRLDSSAAGSVERLQFSIGHLLTLTFVVACLISIRNCVEPYAIEIIETPDAVIIDYFDEAVCSWLFPAAVFGVLGILPVWSVLATKQLVLSCVGLLAAGVCAGYWLGRFHEDPPSLWMPVTIPEVVTVAVSLLVVRSCGYRLLRLPARRVNAAPDRQDRSDSEEKSA
jgi:hypothetical protein